MVESLWAKEGCSDGVGAQNTMNSVRLGLKVLARCGWGGAIAIIGHGVSSHRSTWRGTSGMHEGGGVVALAMGRWCRHVWPLLVGMSTKWQRRAS